MPTSFDLYTLEDLSDRILSSAQSKAVNAEMTVADALTAQSLALQFMTQREKLKNYEARNEWLRGLSLAIETLADRLQRPNYPDIQPIIRRDEWEL